MLIANWTSQFKKFPSGEHKVQWKGVLLFMKQLELS